MIRAQTIIVGFCILTILSLAITNIFVVTNKIGGKFFSKSNLYLLLTIIFIIFPLGLIQLYSINCMIEGNCVFLTWLIVVIALVSTIAYVVFFIIILSRLKRVQRVTTSEKDKAALYLNDFNVKDLSDLSNMFR